MWAYGAAARYYVPMKKLVVTKESPSGRNQEFQDTSTGKIMGVRETVRRIEQGQFPGYHVQHVGKRAFPRSNPNRSSKDNLG